jgi:hypothetical protein
VSLISPVATVTGLCPNPSQISFGGRVSEENEGAAAAPEAVWKAALPLMVG